MAEFKTVMGEFQRLCSKRECGRCPVGERAFNERESYCCVWVKKYPEEAERIIMQWSSEHPLITNGRKFREVFGINLDSIEVVCHDGEGVYHYQDVRTWLDKEYKGKDGQDG